MAVRRLAMFILVLGSVGCASIQPVHDPATFIAESNPDVVYVTHNNGALLTISQPRVSGDSLLGTWDAASQSLALPLNHFRRIAARQRDKTRTTLLVASVSVVTVSMAYLLTRGWAKARQPCGFDGAYQFQGCDTDDP